jgi:hypothetical protein
MSQVKRIKLPTKKYASKMSNSLIDQLLLKSCFVRISAAENAIKGLDVDFSEIEKW